MSRKLLIRWYLLPIFTLLTPFLFAQEHVSITDYYFFNYRNQNFSVHPWLSYSSVSIFSQNQFLLKELCSATVSGCYNIKGNSITVNTSHFGYSKYGIFTISSGFARVFAKRISFGMQVHYLMHHAESFPKIHSVTFDLSLYGQISPKVGIGVSAYNPANFKYGITGKEKIPMLYILMLNYKINDKVLLAVAASKQLPGTFDISGTVCFRDKFYGFTTDFSLKQAGVQFSFWWKKMQFDAGGSFNYRMGFSPGVRIGYLFSTESRRAQGALRNIK